MAIKLKSTKDYSANGVKVLVYGRAGVGKTTLCATAPNPIIISAEAGLLSIAGKDIPTIEIHNIDELFEAYEFICSEDCKKLGIQTVCLDSISEIAEQCLAEEKKKNKDGRKAYAETSDRMAAILRTFRDIPDKNIVFIAKQDKVQDDQSALHYGPSMPGNKFAQGMGYFFDEVFALNIGEDEDGTYRYIQTQPDTLYEAKDRSGALNDVEKADLTYIFDKIKGVTENED